MIHVDTYFHVRRACASRQKTRPPSGWLVACQTSFENVRKLPVFTPGGTLAGVFIFLGSLYYPPYGTSTAAGVDTLCHRYMHSPPQYPYIAFTGMRTQCASKGLFYTVQTPSATHAGVCAHLWWVTPLSVRCSHRTRRTFFGFFLTVS